MTEQELLDEGYGLWYIVLEHTNHRSVNGSYEPFIFDDIEVAKEKAVNTSGGKYLPMMVKDFNLKYKKHMPEPQQHSESRKVMMWAHRNGLER